MKRLTHIVQRLDPDFQFWGLAFVTATTLMLVLAPPPIVGVASAQSYCQNPCGTNCCGTSQVCCNGQCCTGNCLQTSNGNYICCPAGQSLCGNVCCTTGNCCDNSLCGLPCDDNRNGTPESCYSCPPVVNGKNTQCKQCDANQNGIYDSCYECDLDPATGLFTTCKVCDPGSDGTLQNCYTCNTRVDGSGKPNECFTCKNNPTDTSNNRCYACDTDGDGEYDACVPAGSGCCVGPRNTGSGIVNVGTVYNLTTQCCCENGNVANNPCP